MFEFFQPAISRREAIDQLEEIITRHANAESVVLNPWTFDRIVSALKFPTASLFPLFIHYSTFTNSVFTIKRSWRGVWFPLR